MIQSDHSVVFNHKNKTIMINQEMLELCDYHVSVMMDKKELSFLIACLIDFDWKNNNDAFIVEIGAYIGNTTSLMAKVLKLLGLNVKIISVDPFELAWDEINNAKGSYVKYLDTIKNEKVDDACFPVVTFSDRACSVLRSRIAILVIDGCHKYECVKNDLENYQNLVVNGGFIFVDDYGGPYPEVLQAFDEWFSKQSQFQLIHKQPDDFIIVQRII